MIAGRWISFLFVYLPTLVVARILGKDEAAAHALAGRVATLIGIGLLILTVLAATGGWQPGQRTTAQTLGQPVAAPVVGAPPAPCGDWGVLRSGTCWANPMPTTTFEPKPVATSPVATASDPTPTRAPAVMAPTGDDTPVALKDRESSDFALDANWTNSVPVTVTKVIDGDTVVVKVPGGKTETVQVLGIRTPERGRREYKGAIADLRSALKWGEEWLEADAVQPNRDKSGRLLRHLWVGVNELPTMSGRLYSEYALHWRTETKRSPIKHKYAAFLRYVDNNRAINEPIPNWP